MARLSGLSAALMVLSLGSGMAGAETAQRPARKAAPAATPPAAAPVAPTAPVQAAPGAPAGKPAQWPKTLDDAKAAAEPVVPWTSEEIEAGRARCNALLAGLDVASKPVEPIREGDCGSPAPIEVTSFGRSPAVTLSTPAIITCDMAAAFAKWLRTDLQAAAREHLGSAVVRVEVMSAYSCRYAYGRKKTRMSEHGRANALDIAAFTTARGETVEVLADWGPTERDIKAQIAAAAARKADEARAGAARREAEKPLAAGGPAPRAPSGAPIREAGAGDLRGSVSEPGLGAVDLSRGASTWRQLQVPPPGLSQPARLGGPKAGAEAPAAIVLPPLGPKARFLRRIHDSACRAFATILGPEANEAHRNHFHIDMAERTSSSYCE